MNLQSLRHIYQSLFLIVVFAITTGSAISCFECQSLDGDMQACEDEFAPYNVTGHLFTRDCTVGHLGFEAFYCIKIKGVKRDGHTLVIRTCSVTDWGSQCGDFFFEQGDKMETLSGCLASCNYDGCNTAASRLPTRRGFFIILSTSILIILVVVNIERRTV